MKAYKFEHNEILINDTCINEYKLADAYNKLFDELLLSRNISTKKVYLSFNLINSKFSSTPHVVKALLSKKILPAFEFLICKN